MRILLDGVNPESSSGPNSFARKLAETLTSLGQEITLNRAERPDVRLAFIQSSPLEIPTALRLDGIYFNTRQDWRAMNADIKRSYDRVDLIVHQTEFDKLLIERYFGEHQSSVVIRNAGDPMKAMGMPPLVNPTLDSFEQTWVCASAWRPHKRLRENIRYFREHAGPHDCLVVAGDPSAVADTLKGIDLTRVFFAGSLDQATLTSLYRRSAKLIHLAWLDHCPNVVVDARAAGCRIICSSSGGTEEVAGSDAIVIEEDAWDLSPIDLYDPPTLDFSRKRLGSFEHLNDMIDVAVKYIAALEGIKK